MKFIQNEFSVTLEVKKSKFITHICPYNDFKNLMKSLKEQHPKARHFVYAYRYLNEFKQIVENSSDDGEPKGTSGKPSLSVLNGAAIINTGVIIVRYFGGTRLGTGGLVRAYSDAVNLVCKDIEFKQYEDLIIKDIVVSYSNLSRIQYKLKELDINIIKQEFNESIILTLQATKEKFDLLNI